MQIDELDEWQGMTPEHINDWLHANGWKQTKPTWWEKGEGGFMFDPQTFDQVWFWLYALASECGHSGIQAMLREINPRMRKGWPSEAALAAHPNWMIKLFDDDAFVVVWPVAHIIERKERAPQAEIGCWPTDSHGNKVRWPTDAEGNML